MGRPKKAESQAAGKRKAAAPKKISKKAKKDPNKPKRPPSAFFVFMDDFRKEFNEKNPKNKSVAAVSKAGGDRWKSLSESDKAPFVAKAEKHKEEYNKKMDAYNKKPEKSSGRSKDEEEEEEEQAEGSKSEVEDEEDDEVNFSNDHLFQIFQLMV
ncbi:hypothetical protein LUZ63_002840 [Rhynchospora breviuscula]|uniref:HMG box domain-containing protein n=1 Tax=Rhynchospora breviuscula TaxID=2022672 RepID=A0A9Q0HYE8_9POAL|nr:hypothetical protein LUZ63_002840 [Rhynchospora breviuscula]